MLVLSVQQLMFLYLYLVYLYQFVKRKKKYMFIHSIQLVYCAFFFTSSKLFGFISLLSRHILL